MDSMPAVFDRMVAYAQDAVLHAKSAHGITLDYSPDSVKQVEDILSRDSRSIPRGSVEDLPRRDPSMNDVDIIAHMYGAYIGETLRRVADAEWSLVTELVPGETLISLRRGTVCIFPVEKVYKRLAQGTGSNVSVYVDVLLEKLWE